MKVRFYNTSQLESLYKRIINVEISECYYTVIINDKRKYVNMTRNAIFKEFKINVNEVPLDEEFLVLRRKVDKVTESLEKDINLTKFIIYKQKGVIYGKFKKSKEAS